MKEVSFNYDLNQEIMITAENSDFSELVDSLMEKLCCEPWFVIVKMKKDQVGNVMEALEAIKAEIDGLLLIFKMLTDTKIEHIIDTELDMAKIYNENQIIYMEIIMMNDGSDEKQEYVKEINPAKEFKPIEEYRPKKQPKEDQIPQKETYQKEVYKVQPKQPTQEQIYEPKSDARKEPKYEHRPDVRQEQRYEPKPDIRQEQIYEPRQEYRREPKYEHRNEQRQDPRYEPKNEPRNEFKNEQKYDQVNQDTNKVQYRPRIKDLMENDELRQQLEQQEKRPRNYTRGDDRKDSGAQPYERKRYSQNDGEAEFKHKRPYNDNKPRFNDRKQEETGRDFEVYNEVQDSNKEVEQKPPKDNKIHPKPYIHYGSYKNALDGITQNNKPQNTKEQADDQPIVQNQKPRGHEGMRNTSDPVKYEIQPRTRVMKDE